MFQDNRTTTTKEDFYPTPAWATRALLEHVISPSGVAWEPACGTGSMSSVLADYFTTVISTDIEPRGIGTKHDFLLDEPIACDWIITNPPYSMAMEFVLSTFAHPGKPSVAMLVRDGFLESKKRYAKLFSIRPPSVVALFSERPGFFPGKVVDIGSGQGSCWVVWDARPPTSLVWIPPCKAKLEKPEDYEQVTEEDLTAHPKWRQYFEKKIK